MKNKRIWLVLVLVVVVAAIVTIYFVNDTSVRDISVSLKLSAQDDDALYDGKELFVEGYIEETLFNTSVHATADLAGESWELASFSELDDEGYGLDFNQSSAELLSLMKLNFLDDSFYFVTIMSSGWSTSYAAEPIE